MHVRGSRNLEAIRIVILLGGPSQNHRHIASENDVQRLVLVHVHVGICHADVTLVR